MRNFWKRVGRGKQTRDRTRCLRPEVDGLEPRELPIVGPVTASLAPRILKPIGRFVPVTVTGTMPVQLAGNEPVGRFQVIDEYRKVEPRRRFTLVQGRLLDAKKNTYQYDWSFTVNLDARRSTAVPDGRHYYITYAIGDKDNVQSQTLAVFVQREDRGPRSSPRVVVR